MGELVQQKTAPDPRIAEFIREISKGTGPLDAAAKTGLAPTAAQAVLTNPAVVVALQRDLSARFLSEAVPLAINSAVKLLGDPNTGELTRARTTMAVLQLFARASVQERMEKTNKIKSLDEMSLDELEAAAGAMRNAVDERKNIVDVDANPLD